ncbi:hypothetical protein [Enterococcus hermanniensis]|uniref:Uncharacterized protein n=1 Tax=Enterococcus hermanniensis TaxID=249189 RepID=A0A1L8TRT8_9ENTE|nr:hypothetical protein [Enterococcus hermanniensis]OJG47046.1 hypothetical protein RV04_GL000293 [Enterococcus hermanniensis]
MKTAMVLSTILIALVNFYLFYVYFKEKKIKDSLEKLAVMFGVNMSVLFIDSLLLFFGALAEEGFALLTILIEL